MRSNIKKKIIIEGKDVKMVTWTTILTQCSFLFFFSSGRLFIITQRNIQNIIQYIVREFYIEHKSEELLENKALNFTGNQSPKIYRRAYIALMITEKQTMII